MVQLPDVHPQTARPTERPRRAKHTDAKNRGTRDNYVRLRHVEPARVLLCSLIYRISLLLIIILYCIVLSYIKYSRPRHVRT